MERFRSSAVVALVSGSHVVNHAYLLLFAPAFPLLRAEFGVSLAAVGLLLGVVNVVITASQLPLGYVSDTYSHTAVLVVSLVFGTFGCLLAAVAPSYGWLLVAAAVMGFGVAGHHPAHYPLISVAVEDAYRSRAYSVHGFAGAIGLAVPFGAVPAAVAVGLGWRTAFAAIGIVGLMYTLLTVVAVQYLPRSITRAGADATCGRTERLGSAGPTRWLRAGIDRFRGYVRTLLGTPLVLLLTALWFVNSIAVWGIRTYAATLLDVGYGLSAATASTVASAMFVVGAFVLLLGGYLADRIGPMSMLFAGYGSLVVLAVAVSSALLPVILAVVAVLSLAATIDVSRAARSTLTDLASERGDVGKNFALITLGVSVAGAIAPPIFGYVIEVSGVGVAFIVVAATAAVALGLSVCVRRIAARTSI